MTLTTSYKSIRIRPLLLLLLYGYSFPKTLLLSPLLCLSPSNLTTLLVPSRYPRNVLVSSTVEL